MNRHKRDAYCAGSKMKFQCDTCVKCYVTKGNLKLRLKSSLCNRKQNAQRNNTRKQQNNTQSRNVTVKQAKRYIGNLKLILM